MRRAGGTSGFSLVEVALALGVVAFALVAIVGLMSISMKSGKDSMDDTLLSAMTTAAISGLRAQHFIDATHLAGASGVLPGTAATSSTAATVLPIEYFDDSGTLLSSASNALYQCTMTLQPDGATAGAPDANGNQAVNMVRVSLAFAWPIAAAGNLPNVRIVTSSIARY